MSDDNEEGGEICFEFGTPLEVFFVSLLDIESGRGDFIDVTVADESVTRIPIEGLGDNAAQTVGIGFEQVTKLCVRLMGDGAITNLSFCAPSATQTPSSSPTDSVPSSSPTESEPVQAPSSSPTDSVPSSSPTEGEPVQAPSSSPTDSVPSSSPTEGEPVQAPSSSPTDSVPSSSPTEGEPIASSLPSAVPSGSSFPSTVPSGPTATNLPSLQPSQLDGSDFPTTSPSGSPSATPTTLSIPSTSPSVSPAPTNTGVPSASPSEGILGSISGTVLEDVDNNDTGDVGIANVTITLLDSTGTPVATTTTDSAGNFVFNDVPIGSYTLVETNLPNYLDVSDTDGPNDNMISVTLTVGAANSTGNVFVDELVSSAPSVSSEPSSTPTVSPGPTNTGVPSGSPSEGILGSISGTVLEDVDNNDTGDVGIPNVTITLLDSTGTPVATTTTDSAGNFVFNDVPLGSYTLVETNLPNYLDVSDTDGPNDNMISVTLTVGAANSTGNVFVDELVSSAPSVSSQPSSTPTASPAPTNTGVPSSSPSEGILGSISGTVLEDVDNNDTGDVGIPNVTITLLDSTGTPVATTTTDSAGNFVFNDVPMGSYTLVETNLPNYLDVSDTDGPNDNMISVTLSAGGVVNSTGNVFVDELVSSAPSISVEPSSTPTVSPFPTNTGVPSASPTVGVLGSISGNVKEDLDNDDTGDVGIGGVKVELLDEFGNIVAGTATDASGSFVFNDVPMGSYTIVQTNLQNYVDVSDTDGPNDNMISVVLGAGGVVNSTENCFVDELVSSAPSVSSVPSSAPTISPFPTNTGVPSASPTDGVLGSITGNVKEDVDNNDTGDVGLGGVTITLVDSSGTIVSITITDSLGNFVFNDLPMGSYLLLETNLPNYLDVSDTDGANDNRIAVQLSVGGVTNSTGNMFVDELLSSSPSISMAPSASPSFAPTPPSVTPPPISEVPSSLPTFAPTDSSASPTVSSQPSGGPSYSPSLSKAPTRGPTLLPTSSSKPSLNPTDVPTETPTNTVFPSVSLIPTEKPSVSGVPSSSPSSLPSVGPSISVAPSFSPTSLPTLSSAPTEVCVEVTIDFQVDGDDFALIRGQYVSDDWFTRYGLTITAAATEGGFTPDGQARIFDSSTPGSDPDLGSPNEDCAQLGQVSGPGQGAGGRRGQRGQNCNPLGNLLIIQSEDKSEPDDNPTGGNITFAFDVPVQEFLSIGLIDIENNDAYLVVDSEDLAAPVIVDIEGEGNNAVQTVSLPFTNVRSVTIHFPAEGAVTFIHFCAEGDFPTASPLPTLPPRNDQNCTSVDFPCSAYPNKLQVCYYSDTTKMWMDLCIAEKFWADLRLVFPSYCGPCLDDPQDPNLFRPNILGNITEVTFDGDSESCPAGEYGVENVDVIHSDGKSVNFRLQHGFCPSLEKTQVWFGNPAEGSPSLCFDYTDQDCNEPISEYTAKCFNGWADLFIVAENDDDFRQNIDVVSPRCQPGYDFVDFNPQKRCCWQIRIPCICDSRRRELLSELAMAEATSTSSVVAAAAQDEPESEALPVRAPKIKPSLPIAMPDTECERKSLTVDVIPVAVDSCAVDPIDAPISLVSQDGNSVTFALSQVWKGCGSSHEQLGWVAADYVSRGDELTCTKFSNLDCGFATTLTAQCEDGATVIDLYVQDEQPDLFYQKDGSSLVVPEACEATGSAEKMCHLRYVLKCEPSQCDKSRQTSRRRLGRI